jgi:hypothetical protein
VDSGHDVKEPLSTTVSKHIEAALFCKIANIPKPGACTRHVRDVSGCEARVKRNPDRTRADEVRRSSAEQTPPQAGQMKSARKSNYRRSV